MGIHECVAMSGGVEGRKEYQESAKDPWIQSQISSLLYVSSHPPFQSLYFEFLILLLIILLLLFFLITLISAMAIILLLLLIIDCSSRPFSKHHDASTSTENYVKCIIFFLKSLQRKAQ